MEKTFKALVVEENSRGEYQRSIRKWSIGRLPKHKVLVRVYYSSLNYKDALSASGHRGVTQEYPHIPGIDAAGIVEKSEDERFQSGDQVIVTSYDLGQNTPGGFGRFIRVPADWVVPLPKGLHLFESMALGTAGLTAALGVHHLRRNDVTAGKGTVLVTGATGGVGTMAVGILARLGYEVVAATGKTEQESFLKKIGAGSVIHREEVQDSSSKPLLGGQWAGAIETVGGSMLDTVLRQTHRNGTVACCGNVLGHELHTNVYPFILRGVTLAGIDSGNCPMKHRRKLWKRLGTSWKPRHLSEVSRSCSLEELNREIDLILEGGQVGRVVVEHEE